MSRTPEKQRPAQDPFAVIPEKMRTIVRDAFAWACGQLERGERVKSHWVIGNADFQTAVMLPTDTSSWEAKEAGAEHARKIAAMQKADFVLNIGETWALPPADVTKHQAIVERYGSIAGYPGRVDTLFIYLESYEGVFSVMGRIRPVPPSKKRRKVDAPSVMKPDEAQGVLTQILPGVPLPTDTVH